MRMLEDVAYGPDERNVLDVYLADSIEPAPVLIYFHGGGYLRGDKTQVNDRIADLKRQCLDTGISVVSANYRFISTAPFPAPMNDGTRAIQFVRHMAEEWNIDPGRVALCGGSAGAHISLWNAFKGNQADAQSDDPVDRCDSSACAVITLDGQITKDQKFYEQHCIGKRLQPNILMFYGVEQEADLLRPDIRELAREASAINFLTASSPPVLTQFFKEFTSLPLEEHLTMDHVVHHPVHGYVLKREMGKLGVECMFRHPGDPLREGEEFDFLQRQFTRARA